MEKADIVVIGAGFVGATFALAAASLGLKVHVADKQGEVNRASDPRYSCVTPDSRALFHRLGVWSRLDEAVVSPVRGIELGGMSGGAPVLLDGNAAQMPALGYSVPNDALRHALLARLAEHPGITLHAPTSLCGTSMQDEGSRPRRLVLLGKEGGDVALCARLLVGADGLASAVRRLIGIPFTQKHYGMACLVTTLTLTEGMNGLCRERLGPICALLPINPDLEGRPRGNLTCAMERGALARALSMPPAALRGMLEDRLGLPDGAIVDLTPPRSFPLQRLHCHRYWDERATLVGDAAHVVPPLGGQGLNLGLRDVRALAWALEQALAGGWGLAGPQTQAAYQRWHVNHAWLTLLDLGVSLGRRGGPMAQLAQSAALRLMERSPLREAVINAAVGRRPWRGALNLGLMAAGRLGA